MTKSDSCILLIQKFEDCFTDIIGSTDYTDVFTLDINVPEFKQMNKSFRSTTKHLSSVKIFSRINCSGLIDADFSRSFSVFVFSGIEYSDSYFVSVLFNPPVIRITNIFAIDFNRGIERRIQLFAKFDRFFEIFKTSLCQFGSTNIIHYLSPFLFA